VHAKSKLRRQASTHGIVLCPFQAPWRYYSTCPGYGHAACCLPSCLHCLLLQPALLSLAGRRCCGLRLSPDRCIIDQPLIYFMVGVNSYSRLPGNLDVFIPGNTEMKKSGNPGHTGFREWIPYLVCSVVVCLLFCLRQCGCSSICLPVTCWRCTKN